MKYGHRLIFENHKDLEELLKVCKANARDTVGPGKEIGVTTGEGWIQWRYPSGDEFKRILIT